MKREPTPLLKFKPIYVSSAQKAEHPERNKTRNSRIRGPFTRLTSPEIQVPMNPLKKKLYENKKKKKNIKNQMIQRSQSPLWTPRPMLESRDKPLTVLL